MAYIHERKRWISDQNVKTAPNSCIFGISRIISCTRRLPLYQKKAANGDKCSVISLKDKSNFIKLKSKMIISSIKPVENEEEVLVLLKAIKRI